MKTKMLEKLNDRLNFLNKEYNRYFNWESYSREEILENFAIRIEEIKGTIATVEIL